MSIFLVLRSSTLLCAIPAASVAETMRPLPITPLRGAPPLVLGVSVIRGTATPVLDLAALITGAREPAPTRFVRLRLADRAAALAVRDVVGIRDLDPDAVAAPLPRLFDAIASGAVESLAALDRELVVVLRVARVVPDEVWDAMARERAPA